MEISILKILKNNYIGKIIKIWYNANEVYNYKNQLIYDEKELIYTSNPYDKHFDNFNIDDEIFIEKDVMIYDVILEENRKGDTYSLIFNFNKQKNYIEFNK